MAISSLLPLLLGAILPTRKSSGRGYNMGRFFRDIWTEVVAAGVLAAMSSIIGIVQDTPPITIAIISFVVILVAFRISYYFQDRKLKARLGIEKERWNRVREEKLRLRQPYENRLEITKLLSQMHDKSVEYTQEQLQKNITKKKWEIIARSTTKVIPKLTIITMLLV